MFPLAVDGCGGGGFQVGVGCGGDGFHGWAFLFFAMGFDLEMGIDCSGGS